MKSTDKNLQIWEQRIRERIENGMTIEEGVIQQNIILTYCRIAANSFRISLIFLGV